MLSEEASTQNRYEKLTRNEFSVINRKGGTSGTLFVKYMGLYNPFNSPEKISAS